MNCKTPFQNNVIPPVKTEFYRLWNNTPQSREDVSDLLNASPSRLVAGLHKIALLLPDTTLSAEVNEALESADVFVVEIPKTMTTSCDAKISEYIINELRKGFEATNARLQSMAQTIAPLSIKITKGGFLDSINDPANQTSGLF